MDKTKKAVIRLRSSVEGSYLVACPDKKSVAHVTLGNSGGGLTSIENALWVVTRCPDSSGDDKQVCFISGYGKLLAAPLSLDYGTFAIQMEVPKDGISSNVKGYATRWKFEKTGQTKGGTEFYVRPCIEGSNNGLYLMALPGSNVGTLGTMFWPFSWALKQSSRWVVEVAQTRSAVNFVQQPGNRSLQVEKPSLLVGQLVLNNPSIYSGNASRLGGAMDINSGRNINHGSGTQTNGDVNIIREIGRQENIVNFISMPVRDT